MKRFRETVKAEADKKAGPVQVAIKGVILRKQDKKIYFDDPAHSPRYPYRMFDATDVLPRRKKMSLRKPSQQYVTYSTLTLTAAGPFCPCSMSNVTRSPSLRDLNPAP